MPQNLKHNVVPLVAMWRHILTHSATYRHDAVIPNEVVPKYLDYRALLAFYIESTEINSVYYVYSIANDFFSDLQHQIIFLSLITFKFINYFTYYNILFFETFH